MRLDFSRRWQGLLTVPVIVFSAVPFQLSAATTSPLYPASQVSSSLIAQRSRTREIRFAPGTDSSTIKDSVVNGTRDIYRLGAQKGQTMTIKIVSLEQNAVFDIAAPPNRLGQRRVLKYEATTWSQTLPETGDYQISVGTTRGNAQYRLQVTIR